MKRVVDRVERGVLMGKKAWKFAWQGSVAAVCLAIWVVSLVSVATLTGLCWAGFFRWYMLPTNTSIRQPLTFDYSRSAGFVPSFSSPFGHHGTPAQHLQPPSATVFFEPSSLRYQGSEAYGFKFNDHDLFNISVELELPETPFNLGVGMFSLVVAVHTASGGPPSLFTASHMFMASPPPGVLSGLLSTSHTSVQSVVLHLSPQWRLLPDDRGVVRVQVNLSQPLHLLSSHLNVDAQLVGLPGIFQRHPYLTFSTVFLASASITFFFSATVSAVAIYYLISLAKEPPLAVIPPRGRRQSRTTADIGRSRSLPSRFHPLSPRLRMRESAEPVFHTPLLHHSQPFPASDDDALS
eukprot:Sspe_Gene.109435::Locus_89573_Transcript_1_1_Confidence_1.000_Length_1345::g.109435::m.109435